MHRESNNSEQSFENIEELFSYFGWQAFVWNQQLRLLMRLEQKQKSKNLGLHFGRFMYGLLYFLKLIRWLNLKSKDILWLFGPFLE